ncbi:tRNA pseudouridine(38-40) synthase TruA [Aquihabitans sp. G128]|uniref:tRNA pseudouridine(38-40) synthase TruA n=1 Tax=Aquihabitans sp. G128 TaxID=2849779 RepID=UPI001C21232C|nr:tRNA pseudouridine(38-40) synthase TruA [Aquihabitans sp. G128]QXC60337.1 tRNA pseudouridine(38-40) synthase TruA [Aquihabitans sp. G128]
MTLFDPAELTEGPVGPLVRVRLVVAYDGAPFHGFAVNTGVRTVAGVLTDTIGTVLGHAVELTCAGRTDKGVHARGQVVTFDAAPERLDLPGLMRSVNKMCGPAIAVTDAALVADDFDARFSARARRYRYRILNRPAPDPFQAHFAWHVDEPLSLPAMVLACDPLIGSHDFAAFCRRPKRRDGEQASLVRDVTEAVWHDDGGGDLRFEIEASSFCHQMVRSVVGTLVDVGRGKKHAGDVLAIIRSGDRNRAGDLAPPQGLTLWTVRYDGWDSAPG